MSISVSCDGPVKKISSCVRPGVCEVRASARRPVSALIRLDLPTLERPATAISMPRMRGSAAADPAAAANCQSPANSLRPASISARVKGEAVASDGASGPLMTTSRLRRGHFFFEKALQAFPCGLEIVPQLDLGAVLVHDHALLGDRERVVPGPVDHDSGREARNNEGEDDRSVVEVVRLRGVGRGGVKLI